MRKIFRLSLIILASNLYSQNINFITIDKSYSNFIKNIELSNEYFIGKNYYQAKVKEISIRHYEGLVNNAIIQFKKKSDFDKLILEIFNNAYFDFRYCADYNSPVVFNFHTSLGNKIRFNIDEWQVSVEYPNSYQSLLIQIEISYLYLFVIVIILMHIIPI